MKNLLTGILFQILPAYIFFSWIYVFNKYENESQQTRSSVFEEQFVVLRYDSAYLIVICIALSILSVYFFSKGLKANSSRFKILSLALTIYASFISVFLIGFMM